MRYASYMPQNTKDLAINQTMVADGNRQDATAFARANNSDLLRSLKHLIETRLKIKFSVKMPLDIFAGRQALRYIIQAVTPLPCYHRSMVGSH